jgi:hypothetical protein
MSGTSVPGADDGAGGSAAPDGAAERDGLPAGGNARERREERRFAEMARRAREAEERAARLESRLAEAAEAGRAASVAALERDLAVAQDEAKRAFTDGDPERHVAATMKVAEVIAAKRIAASPAPAGSSASPGAPSQPRYTPTTQRWLDANPWFGSDAAKTADARAAHGAAVAANMVPDTPEYWAFIQTTVNRKHRGLMKSPDGDGEGGEADDEQEAGDAAAAAPAPPARQPSGAAPVNRSSGASGRPGSELRLTAEQVEAAKVAGVTPQAYAAALRDGIKTGAYRPASRG